jgi:hypothetical protein
MLTYEAAVRAFATERGRNLFLYEERPEAFVPGAVRTRLALMGARLPPGAARSPRASGLLRHLWRATEPSRLRGEAEGIGSMLRTLTDARRRLRQARPWNPLRAFGPRLQPVVHMGDEGARAHAEQIALAVLPRDAKGRPRAAQRFNARAAALSKALGGVYHAERFWLFLPSGDGLPRSSTSRWPRSETVSFPRDRVLGGRAQPSGRGPAAKHVEVGPDIGGGEGGERRHCRLGPFGGHGCLRVGLGLLLLEDAVLVSDAKSVQEGPEQGTAVCQVKGDEEAVGERLPGVEDGREDAGLGVGRKGPGGLGSQVAGLDDGPHRGAGQLRGGLDEERAGGGEAIVERQVLPETGRGRVERHLMSTGVPTQKRGWAGAATIRDDGRAQEGNA